MNIANLIDVCTLCSIMLEIRPRIYKTFFMLNSAEHEILNAHKYKNIKKCGFLGPDKPRMLFFPTDKC